MNKEETIPVGITSISAKELPYLSHIPRDGRSTWICDYYNSKEQQFYTYKPNKDGQLLVIKPADLIEGRYLAESVARESDYPLFFNTFVMNHLSFPDLIRSMNDIKNDLLNSLTCIHKYFVVLDYANLHNDFSYYLMIGTEIEYAFANHRAFYDRLHKCICVCLQKRRVKVQLPDSFARMLETRKNIATAYRLPKPLVEFYQGQRESFLTLRKIRDNILHGGFSPDMVFKFEDGFAIGVEYALANQLSSLKLWPSHLLKPHGLGSILAIFEYLVSDMLNAMDRLRQAFISCFQSLPEPMIRGHVVFLRSAISGHFKLLENYRVTHWFRPKIIFDQL